MGAGEGEREDCGWLAGVVLDGNAVVEGESAESGAPVDVGWCGWPDGSAGQMVGGCGSGALRREPCSRRLRATLALPAPAYIDVTADR